MLFTVFGLLHVRIGIYLQKYTQKNLLEFKDAVQKAVRFSSSFLFVKILVHFRRYIFLKLMNIRLLTSHYRKEVIVMGSIFGFEILKISSRFMILIWD